MMENGKLYRVTSYASKSLIAIHGYLFLMNTKQSQVFEKLSGTRLVAATSLATGESLILFARELEAAQENWRQQMEKGKLYGEG